MKNLRPELPCGLVHLEELDRSPFKYPGLQAAIAAALNAISEASEPFALPSTVKGVPGVETDTSFDEFLAKSDFEFDEMVMRAFREEKHLCKFIDPGVGQERWCSVDGCKNTRVRF